MKVNKKIFTCLILFALLVLSGAQCDNKAEEVKKLLTGNWNLIEQTENGEKKNYIMKIEYSKDGDALLIQYDNKNREIYRSNAKWKVSENADSIIWYDDKDTADQKWKLIALTPEDCVMEMEIKTKTENWAIKRHLKH